MQHETKEGQNREEQVGMEKINLLPEVWPVVLCF